jgi:enoyl-CoA hydratase/carnithine racemase
LSLIEVQRGVVSTIRLNNPPLNLVTLELTASLNRALEVVAGDEEVRAVVVTGGEGTFSAGSDVKEFEALRGRALEAKVIFEKDTYKKLANLAMPTIAACDGDALGGGLELALCCDIRVASDQSRFGLPEVGLGVIPGAGGTQRLPRLIGLSRAKEMILTGRIIDSAEAERIGLVNRVVSQGRAYETASEMAESISAKGPVAIRNAKALLDMALDRSLERGLDAETEASERVFDTDDMIEGAHAFLQKRSPRFQGR